MRGDRIRLWFLALIAALAVGAVELAATGRAVAQDQVTAKTNAEPIDYAAWDKDAATAEDVIAAARASNKAMEDLRARIVVWRTRFEAGKSINAAQIETLKAQIAGLGAPPADGTVEAPEIAERRRQLNETLSRQQAPGLAAVEAFSRADGIIRQIDTLIRERQADALLKLLPSPMNPLNWPSGAAVLTQGSKTLWAEVDTSWNNPARRAELRDNLPVIAILLVLAGLLLWRGPGFMERLAMRLEKRATIRGRTIVAALISLGQVVLPVAGMILLVAAIFLSGITGPRLEALLKALPLAALSLFVARWLGSWLFSDDQRIAGIRLTDRPAEARFHVTAIGLVLGIEEFRSAFTTEVRPPLSQAAQAVWLAPVVCAVAVFLFRLGLLLRQTSLEAGQSREDVLFRQRMVSVIGSACALVAIIAPLLAVIGYVAAANALIWPTVHSLGLIGFLILAQRFLTDVYVIVTKSGDEGREALIPVLIGFLLALASLPVFALIWGARPSDLSEVWARFQAGVDLGGTRIAPMALVTLAIVFALGYMVTHILQGAMRTSLLPRTKLDKGAQNAAVAGLGYLGLILSGLAAVTAAGINLSGLAIVAGALSVGVGLGLQNIVQNFVSGVILLVERPISEGDTIEVSGKTGVVKAISVRSTRISTGDQAEVVVPNAQFISGMVTNFTRENLKSKLVVPVTVGYGADTRIVEKALRDIVEAQPLVVLKPPPSVHLTGFTQTGMTFEVGAILSDLNFRPAVLSEVNHQIVERFRALGIELPHDRLASATELDERAAAVMVSEAPQAADAAPVKKADINNVPDDDVDPDRR